MEVDMVRAFRFGPMTLATKANGKTIRQMAVENFGMRTGTCMRASGLMIRRMATAPTLT